MSEIEYEGPTNEADFAQFATESGVMDWLLDTPQAEEVPHEAPEPEATERPRDDQGRFVSTQVEEVAGNAELPEADNSAESATEEPTEESQAEEDSDVYLEIDDSLQAYLDKYDGDLNKALRAAAEGQSLIGRQGNELGDLRSELAELKQMLAQQAERPQQQFFGPYRNDLDENPEALLYEALERGDNQTATLALQAWGDEEPFKAAMFLQQAQQGLAQQPQAQPAPPPVAESEGLEVAMAAVVQRHPDVEKYLPGLGETAKEFPTLRNFMEQGTPAQKAQAFEELLVITKTRSLASDTSGAMKRVILKTQEEVRKDKADAQVVSASNQTAATPKQSRLDEFYAAFEEASGQIENEHWIHRT